jgi:predicted DsbA family dithiol-disulfide isomerase
MRDRFGADVEWLPFDLHPEYPEQGIPREQLIAKYGEAFHERLKGQFESLGLVYNPPPHVVPNTRKALRLTELARERGLHEAMHDRLMEAYWEEAQDIGDPDVLRRESAKVGLEPDDVERVLTTDEYGDRVARATHEAHSIGANAVPAFLLDRRLLVLGAQPRELFEQAYAQLEPGDDS